MSHIVVGNVTATTVNTTQDKTLTLNVATPLATGTVLVGICAGYGVDATIDLTSISDSNGNTWDTITDSGASPSRFVMLAWTRIAAPMNNTDTVTFNLQGSFVRSFALVRAYQGLGSTEFDKDSNMSSGNPQTTPSVSYTGAGRAIAVALYTSENFATNWWANGFAQTVNYNDAVNFDTISIGERTLAGSGSVIPRVNTPIATSWAMAAVTLPELAMPSSSGRRQQTGMMG
jgi:hypothetical protein